MFRRRALRRRLVAHGAPPLDARQLRQLARALDAGAAGALCVPGSAPLQVAALRATRWSELRDVAELRRVPRCLEPLCCNPYHWSRVCKPETPPPPYSRYAMEQLKSKEQGVSTQDARRTDHERLVSPSLTTDGEEKPSWESEWCRLAYWEQARRVGRQVGVRLRAVDVYGTGGDTAHGLSLDALVEAQQSATLPPASPLPTTVVDEVRKTRAKIGLGVTLSLEADGVWLYNRSSEPVFVSSPALDAAAARALLVWRVAPGHCLCIFDPAAPPPITSLPHVGPVDPRSVRISFAKGWGPKYSRRDVTACPCWLEVLLAPHS